MSAAKYATITANLLEPEAGTRGWHYSVSSPEGALVASGGPYRSRGGALAEAIARASALRLQVAPEVLALLLATDDSGNRPSFHVSGFDTALDSLALRQPAANEQPAAPSSVAQQRTMRR